MKHLKVLLLTLLLAVSLAAPAFASAVPDELVVENLNGQQRIVKTYILSPDVDSETLKEPPFDYDGYHYTWAFTTKEEKPYLEVKDVVETVTVETSSKDLGDILAALAPTIAYDDGEYAGELALDHTTLATEASGYTTKYGTITDTKVIDNLDRNDMSYVPSTTVKDGSTLTLKDVEWQVTATDQVGDTLMPCTYQAVASYSASYSYQVATGYITTAEYRGQVTSEGIESITYTVVFVGEKLAEPEPDIDADTDVQPDPAPAPGPGSETTPVKASPILKYLLGILTAACGVALMGAGAFLLYKRRKNVYLYVPGETDGTYQLIGKFRVDAKNADIDIRDVEPYPTEIVAVELKKSAATALAGKELGVVCRSGVHRYLVPQDSGEDWHTFDIQTLQTNL